MAELWAFSSGDALHFAYRARRYDANPIRYMNATELTNVSAAAFDRYGNPITVTQQPSFVANLQAWIGWISSADLAGKEFASIRMTPTLGAGIPAAWATTQSIDKDVNQGLAAVLAQLQGIATTPGRGGARYDR